MFVLSNMLSHSEPTSAREALCCQSRRSACARSRVVRTRDERLDVKRVPRHEQCERSAGSKAARMRASDESPRLEETQASSHAPRAQRAARAAAREL